MDSSLFTFALALIALTSQVIGRRQEAKRRVRRALAAMTDTAIVNIKDGDRVRVTGVLAVHRDTATSPVGWRACLGYRLIVQVKGSGSADDERSGVLMREDCRPFAVADGSGRAIVEGPFLLGIDDDAGWADLPPAASSYLQEARVSLTNLLSHRRKFQFKEMLLVPGDRVTIVGRASVEIDPAGASSGHRSLPMLCRIRGDKKNPVMIAKAAGSVGA
jgi:hypothetical protein